MLTLTRKTPLWTFIAVLLLCLSVITQTAGRNNTGCSAGRLPTAFRAPAHLVNGQVLNLEDRITCNGTVTAWSVCYYINGVEETEINVGIWRENSDSGIFELVKNCTLPVPSINPSFEFVCQQWNLPLEECFNLSVIVDDVIGIHLTEEMTLNTLEQVEGSTLLLRENMNSSGTSLTDHGLYIEARVESDETMNINATLDPTSSATPPAPTESIAPLDPTSSATPLAPTESVTTPDPTERATQRAGIPLWAIYVIAILGAVIVMLVVLILLCALYGYRHGRNQNKSELPSTTPGTVGFQLRSVDLDLTVGHNSNNGTVQSTQPHDIQTAMHNVSMTEAPTFIDAHGTETSTPRHQQTVSKGPTPQASPLPMQPIAKSYHPPHTLPGKVSVTFGRGHLDDSLSPLSPSIRPKALTPLSPGKSRVSHHRFVRRSRSDIVLLSSQPSAARTFHTETGKESLSEGQSDEHTYASIASILTPKCHQNLRRSMSESHLVDLPFENLPHGHLSDQDEVFCASPGSPQPYLQYAPTYSYAYSPVNLTFPHPDKKLDKLAKSKSSLPSSNENTLVSSQQSDNSYEIVKPSNMAATGWFTSPHIPREESSVMETRRKRKAFLDRNPIQNQENQPTFHYDYAIVGSRVRFYSLPGTFPGKRFRPAIKPSLALERLHKEALQHRKPMASEKLTAQNSGITASKTVASGNGYTDLRYSRMDPGWQSTYSQRSDCTDLSVSSPRAESDCDDYYVNDDQYPSGTSPHSHRYMRLQETRKISADSYQLPDYGQSLRRSKTDQSRMRNDVGLQGLTEEVAERLRTPLISMSDNTSKSESDVEYDHLSKSSENDSLVGLYKLKV